MLISKGRVRAGAICPLLLGFAGLVVVVLLAQALAPPQAFGAPAISRLLPRSSVTVPARTSATATVRYDQTDSRFVYSGRWVTQSSRSYSGGNAGLTATPGSVVMIQFDGMSCEWIATKSPTFGKAKVTLDGKKTFTII